MRALLFIVITMLICLVFSCSKNPGERSVESLSLGQCRQMSPVGLATICFDSLVSDSRCPPDALCIWEGVAVVKLTLHDQNKQHSFYLSTLQQHPHYPANDTTVFGYRIALQQLSTTRDPAYPKLKIAITK